MSVAQSPIRMLASSQSFESVRDSIAGRLEPLRSRGLKDFRVVRSDDDPSEAQLITHWETPEAMRSYVAENNGLLPGGHPDVEVGPAKTWVGMTEADSGR